MMNKLVEQHFESHLLKHLFIYLFHNNACKRIEGNTQYGVHVIQNFASNKHMTKLLIKTTAVSNNLTFSLSQYPNRHRIVMLISQYSI